MGAREIAERLRVADPILWSRTDWSTDLGLTRADLMALVEVVEKAAEARDGLAAIFELMDGGWLVRDNRRDHEDGFAIRQINPLRKLGDAKRAYDALAASLAKP